MANPLESIMQAVAPGGAGANVAGGENPMNALMQAMAAGGNGAANPNLAGGGFADVMAGALANVNSMQESLNNTIYTIKFVKAGQGVRDQDKRCALDISAGASMSE